MVRIGGNQGSDFGGMRELTNDDLRHSVNFKKIEQNGSVRCTLSAVQLGNSNWGRQDKVTILCEKG